HEALEVGRRDTGRVHPDAHRGVGLREERAEHRLLVAEVVVEGPCGKRRRADDVADGRRLVAERGEHLARGGEDGGAVGGLVPLALAHAACTTSAFGAAVAGVGSIPASARSAAKLSSSARMNSSTSGTRSQSAVMPQQSTPSPLSRATPSPRLSMIGTCGYVSRSREPRRYIGCCGPGTFVTTMLNGSRRVT